MMRGANVRKLWLITNVAGARAQLKRNLKLILTFSYGAMGQSLYSNVGECEPVA